MKSIKNQMKQTQFKEVELHKSAGILDDFAVRKNIATREGTIEKVPVNNSDITNKLYVDTHSGSAHVIKDEGGADLTARRNLNFTGAGVTATDNAGTNSTDVTIPTQHTQGTDAGLDTGGANAVTAAQAKTAYTHSTNNSQAHSDYMLNTGDTATGAYTFNSNNADVDFAVHGDIDSNMLFVDASTNRVGIGTNAPSTVLHVNGGAFVALGLQAQSLTIDATKKITLDGAGATTYIYESADDILTLKAGLGTFTLNGNIAPYASTGELRTSDIKVTATNKLYLDGGGTTYFSERADGIMQLAGSDVEIDAAKKLYLDDTDHHSYIVESADGIVDVYAGAVNAIKCTAGTVTMPSQPSGRQYRNAAYTLVKNVATKLPFDAENYDNGGNFLSGTYTTPVAGRYLIAGEVNFGSTEDQKAYQVQIRVDGSIATYGAMQGTGTGGIVCAVTDIQNIAANKTIELWYYHNGVADVACGTLTSTTWLAVTLLN